MAWLNFAFQRPLSKEELSHLSWHWLYIAVIHIYKLIIFVPCRCSVKLCIICFALLWGENWPLRSCLQYRLWQETHRLMAAMIKPWMHDQVNVGLAESLFEFRPIIPCGSSWLYVPMCFFLPVKVDTPEHWNGRQATDKELQAATVLQAGWKGYLVREILTAARPGKVQLLLK